MAIKICTVTVSKHHDREEREKELENEIRILQASCCCYGAGTTLLRAVPLQAVFLGTQHEKYDSARCPRVFVDVPKPLRHAVPRCALVQRAPQERPFLDHHGVL